MLEFVGFEAGEGAAMEVLVELVWEGDRCRLGMGYAQIGGGIVIGWE